MSRLSHNVYFASLSIHTQSIHARVYVDIYRVARKVISSPRTSYSVFRPANFVLNCSCHRSYNLSIYKKNSFYYRKRNNCRNWRRISGRPVDNSRKDSNFSNSSDRAKRLDCMKKGNYFPNDKRDVRRIFARVPGRSTYRENWTDQGMAGPHGAFYGRDPSTANNVCYTRRRTSRNVRIISLRIITHYIPRYAVCIVYYAAKKKLWDFCGPVMGLTRGTITMQPARIFVYPRNTWRGISNCIVNNLGKLRV